MSWTNVNPPVTAIHQPTISTCWLACLQMLYVWKGKEPGLVMQTLDADPTIFPDYWKDNGLAPENGRQIARSLGLGCAGDGDMDLDVLDNALRTHGPYWVMGEWKPGYAHVKVIVGCEPKLNLVKLINPWNPSDDEDFNSIEAFNKRGERWKVFGSFIYWV